MFGGQQGSWTHHLRVVSQRGQGEGVEFDKHILQIFRSRTDCVFALRRL